MYGLKSASLLPGRETFALASFNNPLYKESTWYFEMDSVVLAILTELNKKRFDRSTFSRNTSRDHIALYIQSNSILTLDMIGLGYVEVRLCIWKIQIVPQNLELHV
jgi:hypothetical protein